MFVFHNFLDILTSTQTDTPHSEFEYLRNMSCRIQIRNRKYSILHLDPKFQEQRAYESLFTTRFPHKAPTKAMKRHHKAITQ